MIHNDRQRLWLFSRGERIAIIFLILAIAITLAIRTWIRSDEKTTILDTTWIESEIPQFEKQLERPKPQKKTNKEYTPKKQILVPIELESEKL